MNAGNLIFNIIATIIMYTLPIIIYRYLIEREAVPKKKAKRITIWYGCIAVIIKILLISLLDGEWGSNYPLILWSWVNYKILSAGYIPPEEIYANTHKPSIIVHENTEINSIPEVDPPITSNAAVINNSPVVNSSTQEKPRPKFCRYCGQSISQSAHFCPNCGQEIYKG